MLPRGAMPADPNETMRLLWQRMQQHDTDIIRLWNDRSNRMWVNQTNQPGGAPSISSSSSSSSSYTGDSDPPACPDGEECTPISYFGCCCKWTWYNATEGWQVTGCTDACRCGDLSAPCTTTCTIEPTADGEYAGQICYRFGDSCPPPSGCEYGYCEWVAEAGPAWPDPPTSNCTGGGVCGSAPVYDPPYVGYTAYSCCIGGP